MRTAMFKRIVFATDMSDNSIVAAHYALRMSCEWDAHLTILSVIEDEIDEMEANMSYDLAAHYSEKELESYNRANVEKNRVELFERVNRLCDKLKKQLGACQVCPDVSIRTGDPVEQILEETEKDGADLVLIGANRHSLLDNILLRNVAKELVQKSPVPVIAIPLAGYSYSEKQFEKADNPGPAATKSGVKAYS